MKIFFISSRTYKCCLPIIITSNPFKRSCHSQYAILSLELVG
ncbi:hypothetical protein FM106_13990 [Brachybacterium faecium]|nr:hypothetical protein FM106_13990 [Brachybacterium faecium]